MPRQLQFFPAFFSTSSTGEPLYIILLIRIIFFEALAFMTLSTIRLFIHYLGLTKV